MDQTLLTILIVLVSVLLIVVVGAIFYLNKKKSNQDYNFDEDSLINRLKIENHELELARRKQETENLLAIQKIKEEMLLSVQKEVHQINEKVEQRLKVGFQESETTFKNVLERLTRIDAAQKSMDEISKDILSLQSVLTDKSSRGAFGETQLSQILYAVYGEKNNKLFQEQYTFSNRRTVDAVIFAPEPLGAIGVDSKFPLENFRRMNTEDITKEEKEKIRKLFGDDVKKHINDIADRYIIKGETSEHAIMFIPSEVVYLEIVSYHESLLEHAAKKNVMITSPTTLVASLTQIQTITKQIEQSKYANIIQEQLIALGVEFRRFGTRFDTLKDRFRQTNDAFEKLNITTDKIVKRFDQIEKVEKDEDDEDIN